jgi:hypothetical protein
MVLVSILLQSAAGEIRIISSAQARAEAVRIIRDGAPAETESRTLRLAIGLPSGKTAYGDITILYESSTGLMWWFYQGVERLDDSGLLQSPLGGFVVRASDGKVAGFSLYQSVLWIRDSTAHVSSLDDGQAAVLARMKDNAERIEKGTMQWGRSIRLGPTLPDFFLLKGSAAPARGTIREIVKTPGGWRLLLDGPNKNSAEVILDDEYNLIRASVLPSAP